MEGALKHQMKFYQDYCEVKTWEDAIYEGFLNIIKEATNHPKWLPGMPILIDHRELDFSGVRNLPRKVSLTSIHMINKNKPGEARMAVILAPDDAEAYADLWLSISRYFGFPLEHKVFFDREEALHWLMSKKGHSAPYI